MSSLAPNTLYYGDCLDWMQRWDDESVDPVNTSSRTIGPECLFMMNPYTGRQLNERSLF